MHDETDTMDDMQTRIDELDTALTAALGRLDVAVERIAVLKQLTSEADKWDRDIEDLAEIARDRSGYGPFCPDTGDRRHPSHVSYIRAVLIRMASQRSEACRLRIDQEAVNAKLRRAAEMDRLQRDTVKETLLEVIRQGQAS